MVSFHTSRERWQRVWDAAEAKCRLNLRRFGGDPVLVEGGGYEKLWLETQPMGGEMYALRSPEAALNNCLLFMRHQRADGRLPGSLQLRDGAVEPQYDKYQGFCFPYPALNLYFLMGRDAHWLQALKDCLTRFDACLWRTRAVSGNGLLSSFCAYDTGEDRALRYGDAPNYWTADEPPQGYAAVPMTSMDVTSWSYACRSTLAHICRLQGDDAAGTWDRRAAEVAAALRHGLWDSRRGALFDRDSAGRQIDILCHNTLRCMYWGSVSREMADRFVREHLLNPAEFWTTMPLPSVAVNDPAFRNAPENNWSGQPEGLTWQRAILALERYGYHRVVTALGEKLIDAIDRCGCRFTQQYDPFTGEPSLVHAVTHQPVQPGSGEPVQDAYGPTLLSALAYITHRCGIHPHLGQLWWSLGSGAEYVYTAEIGGRRCEIRSDGRRAEMRLDGRLLREGGCGVRVITDEAGRPLAEYPIE